MLGACQASGGPVSGSGPPALAASSAPLLPRSVYALPAFDFQTYERLLYQLRGTPVVVNLWASWCVPCRQEAPALADAAQRFGHRVQFLGVDYQDQRGPAAGFLKEYSVPYPSVFDNPGEIHNRLGFVGLPDTLFYGADGKIVSTWSGPLTVTALRENLERLLQR